MTTPRTDRLDLRLSTEAKQALQAAAMVRQTSVSDFVLASALEAAQEALADRNRFGLDADQWAAFQAALDAPPTSKPRLQQLLQGRSVFE
ncbi:MAG: DUF1778 domain-containing protein [Zoogloea sp.]|nr:DUF1778 domain-containing protein [Zoogloea sp.]